MGRYEDHLRLMDQLTEWIEANHPLKIGEIVLINGGVMRVTEREFVVSIAGDHYWTAKGEFIRADGTPSVLIGTWSQKIDRKVSDNG